MKLYEYILGSLAFTFFGFVLGFAGYIGSVSTVDITECREDVREALQSKLAEINTLCDL